jgi:hypothetical protein
MYDTKTEETRAVQIWQHLESWEIDTAITTHDSTPFSQWKKALKRKADFEKSDAGSGLNSPGFLTSRFYAITTLEGLEAWIIGMPLAMDRMPRLKKATLKLRIEDEFTAVFVTATQTQRGSVSATKATRKWKISKSEELEWECSPVMFRALKNSTQVEGYVQVKTCPWWFEYPSSEEEQDWHLHSCYICNCLIQFHDKPTSVLRSVKR